MDQKGGKRMKGKREIIITKNPRSNAEVLPKFQVPSSDFFFSGWTSSRLLKEFSNLDTLNQSKQQRKTVNGVPLADIIHQLLGCMPFRAIRK